MTLSQTMQDNLCQKLRAVGLTKEETLPLVNLISRQVAAEGPENVVRRLKVLKQAAVNKLAGREVDLPWIAHTPKGPKGPWKVVWSKLESKQYSHRKRAINALMVYASLVLPERACPTTTQERKFLSSVVVPPTDAARRNAAAEGVASKYAWRRAVFEVKKILLGTGWTPRLSQPPEADVFALRHKGLPPKGSEAMSAKVAKIDRMVLSFLGTDMGRTFQPFPEIQACLGQKGLDYAELTHPYNNYYGRWQDSDLPPSAVGVIGSSQEPGYKFRAFAAPNLILQAALEPLKDNLLRAISKLPSDCTFDQGRGVSVVQDWLSRGQEVFAVDLSDATNNFPLVLQVKLLTALGLPDTSVRLLELVSRSPYTLMWDKERTVEWTVGQPLGAGPSFPAFALAHTTLAMMAGLKAGLSALEAWDSFLILGDDFVTNSAPLHSEYRRLLGVLECPISEAKCLQSAVMSEFAGKLITQQHVYHGYKYREMSDKSFLDVLRTLGRKAISRTLLSEKQYATAKALADIPEPYGLGFNPKGVPLADRYQKYLMLKDILSEDKPPPVVTLSELKNQLAYSSNVRTFRYFPADRPKDRETETLVGIKELVKAVPKWAAEVSLGKSVDTVSVAVNSGDPRPDQAVDARRIRRAMDIVNSRLSPSGEGPSLRLTPRLDEFLARHGVPSGTRAQLVARAVSLRSSDVFAGGNLNLGYRVELSDLRSTLKGFGLTVVTPADFTTSLKSLTDDEDIVVSADSFLREPKQNPPCGPSM